MKRLNRKIKKRIERLISSIIVIAIAFLAEPFIRQEARPQNDYLYDVVRVVDGDTIVVNIEGENTKIRLIGVNTPESVHSDSKKNTPEGVIASDYVKDLLEGKQVYIEYDKEKLDQYKRTLAYVYTEDKELVNLKLIELGYGECMFYSPNTKYKKMFDEAMEKAQKNNVGFWGTGFFE